jgi:outer membrane lipoprotein-sorting protein
MDRLKTEKKHGRDRSGQQQTAAVKRLYAKPHLMRFGTVAEYTQGGSLGDGESGDPFVFKN